jgi:general secretion pathway protein H
MSAAHREQGYTLIELLVVMAILSLIATFAIPTAVAVVEGVMLQTDARALVVALRAIQSRAIDRQETITVATANGKLTSLPGDSLDLPDSGELRFLSTDRISFYPDGTSNGGRIAILHGDRSLKVEITWLTAEIRLVDEP